MKYCPTCETRYDEEILRFCMKDGTPLIDEEEPNFVTMPSESLANSAPEEEDDPNEVTVIRRNVPIPSSEPPPPLPPDPEEEISFAEKPPSAPRIVVPMGAAGHGQPGARVIPPYQAPQKTNTVLVVFLTMFGTITLLGIGAIGFWLLTRGSADNTNANLNANANLLNADANLNTNLNIDGNFNFNSSSNLNTNANANLRSPTPTPTPKPSPSPTETPEPDESPTPFVNIAPATPRPSPSPTAAPTNRPVNGGVLNGRAIRLTTPSYPPMARQMRADGQVTVQVSVDENGNVVSAKAVSGHPLLRQSAENAARQSKIAPMRVDNRNVSTFGVLVYNFRNN
jgi:TonB family protein